MMQGLMIGFAMLVCLIVGIAHGKELGNLKAVQEYEQGFKDGWKSALYDRPVHDELEMVCVGLWTATLPEQK
jgi:hydrogenase/urease accessory protein HupE